MENQIYKNEKETNEMALLLIDGKIQNVTINSDSLNENIYYRNAGDDVSWNHSSKGKI